jgi:hypothetical protein
MKTMNSILSGIKNVFVYLDDIICIGKTLEEHNKALKETFKRLSEAGLKLKPQKCKFIRPEVIMLGHRVNEEGIFPDSSKFDAIKNFVQPKDQKGVMRFLGMCGFYRRYIKNFAIIAKPLTKLTSKLQPFSWGLQQTQAFETLKEKLISPQVRIQQRAQLDQLPYHLQLKTN